MEMFTNSSFYVCIYQTLMHQQNLYPSGPESVYVKANYTCHNVYIHPKCLLLIDVPFCRNSLIVYYRVIMSFLVSSTTKSLSHISSTSSDDNKKRLCVWKTALKVLHTLVTILKDYYSRQMLSTCLKVRAL